MSATKVRLLQQMYEVILEDDSAYEIWIKFFPDEPSISDLLDICADSEEWEWACNLFHKLVKEFQLAS